MTDMRRDEDQYVDDGDARLGARSVLVSGWVRAALILGALAVVVVLTLPYALRWRDGSAPPTPARDATPAPPIGEPAVPVTGEPAAAPPASGAPPAPASEATSPVEPKASKTAKSPPAASRKAVQERQRRSEGRASAASRSAPRRARAARPEAAPPAAATTAPRGDHWVQVGAFREASNADRLAARLRAADLPVEVRQVERRSTPASLHQVVVSGSPVEAVAAALGGAATARAAGGGSVVVQPPLELREAVALSRRLASDGMNVRIRRVGGETAVVDHVVRVGPYPGRVEADAARRALEARSVPGFITQDAP